MKQFAWLIIIVAACGVQAQVSIYRCKDAYTNEVEYAQKNNCIKLDGGNVKAVRPPINGLVFSSRADGGEFEMYVRGDRIQVEGDQIAFWVYSYQKTPERVQRARSVPVYSRSIALWRGNCREGTAAYGETVYYSVNDKVVASESGAGYLFSRPIPDSHAEAALELACKLAQQPVQR